MMIETLRALRTFAWTTALMACTVGSPGAAHALKTKTAQFKAIQDTLDRLPLLQGHIRDVPSPIDCREQPRDAVAKTVCQDTLLKQMALLYNRSKAYDYSNVSKNDIDPANFRAPKPPCSTRNCIYNFFKGEINQSLGGCSPFTRNEKSGAGPNCVPLPQ